MNSKSNQWEEIFKRDGHVFPEPAPPVIEFAQRLQEHGCRRVLDLGCGTGRHLVYMAQAGFQVFGLDRAPSGLRLTREWLAKEDLPANLLLADIHQNLPFDENAFDALLSTQVIHHARLAEVEFTAAEIGRMVRPGGLVFISVPTRQAKQEEGWQFEEIEPNTWLPLEGDEAGLPHHFFSPQELQDIFPGFEPVKVRIIAERILAFTGIKSS